MNENLKSKVICISLAVLVLFFSLFAIIKPIDEYSLSERRELDDFPTLTVKTLLSGKFMSEFEDYALDQFPLRDSFRSLKAVVSLYLFGRLDNNDIYIYNDYASKLEYPLREQALERAGTLFERICAELGEENNTKLYLSIIPDKNYFLADESGRPEMDYEKFVAIMRENAPSLEYIDIFPLLSVEDYYLTDTHWKQESIADVADALLAAMGAKNGDEYTENTLPGVFEGVYYGQSALPLKTDELKYLTSDIIDSLLVYDFQNDREIPVYDMELAVGKDPYEMFLSGSLSLLTITNPNATTDRELIVFRDSFGSSIAPLFAQGYAKVTLVDIRYISSMMLEQYISLEGKDILFLYSTLVLNNSETLK